ncbi:MAG: glycosyltransferase family 1 protein [Alphaproteobacteria bacterium]|nr:glycosyltransferase family 1 protein [Alphaproteobacteria bacterium]
MRISFCNKNDRITQGFGHATTRIVNTLIKNDYQVSYSDKSADVAIWFGHPEQFEFTVEKNAYKIGYVAWESTAEKEDKQWKECILKAGVDEIWVPNKFCETVMKQYTDKPIYIFPHAVDKTYEPYKRSFDGKLKFLHVGYPAMRKNLHDTVEAFLELYSDRDDVTLTIKSYEGANLDYYKQFKNINVITETYLQMQMEQLMNEHHCLIYPSWGEGFGLIPLEALGTGMPAIITEGWCDYIKYAEDLKIDSYLTHHHWSSVHSGLMFKPNYQTLLEKMKYVENNIEQLLDKYYEQAFDIHQEYDWDKLVNKQFKELEQRLMLQ